MLAVLRNRNFTLLWFAGLISMVGNWILLAALPFYIFELTGSAMATAGVFMAFMAPGIFLGSIAGVFVDRWDKLRTMLIVNLIQIVVVLLLTMVQSAEQSWIIFLVLVIESSVAQFFGPAENSLLPKLVSEEHLVAANSLNSMNDNLARLVGPAVGGLALAVYGFSSVVMLDALSYALSAALIFFVMVTFKSDSKMVANTVQLDAKPATTLQARIAEVWGEWQAGLKIVRNESILKYTFAIIGSALFADAIISAIFVIFLQEDVGFGSAEFGYIMTARGVGGLIGGIAAAQFGDRVNPRHMLSVSLLLLSSVILFAVNFKSLSAFIIAMIIGGIPAVTMFIAVQTIFHKRTPEEYLGRVFGLFQTVLMLLMFLGSAAAGVLGELIPARQLMIFAAIVYVAAGLVGIWLLRDRNVTVEVAPS